MGRYVAPGDDTHLWEAYEASRSRADRDALVRWHGGLVELVSKLLVRRLPRHFEREELLSYGTFGLIDAVERFDRSVGVGFTVYAKQRIRGAMLDGLRAMDWAPRSVRSASRRYRTALRELRGEMIEEPSHEAVAERMGVSMARLAEILDEEACAQVSPLQEERDEGEGDDDFEPSSFLADEDLDPQVMTNTMVALERLAESVDVLDERERRLVALVYTEGLSFGDIAEVVGVSPSRVAQVFHGALVRLRERQAALV